MRVRAAGVQPYDAAVRAGWTPAYLTDARLAAHSRQRVRRRHRRRRRGPRVLHARAYAEYVVVPADQVTPKPAAMPWEVAGGFSAGAQTAHIAFGELERRARRHAASSTARPDRSAPSPSSSPGSPARPSSAPEARPTRTISVPSAPFPSSTATASPTGSATTSRPPCSTVPGARPTTCPSSSSRTATGSSPSSSTAARNQTAPGHAVRAVQQAARRAGEPLRGRKTQLPRPADRRHSRTPPTPTGRSRPGTGAAS